MKNTRGDCQDVGEAGIASRSTGRGPLNRGKEEGVGGKRTCNRVFPPEGNAFFLQIACTSIPETTPISRGDGRSPNVDQPFTIELTSYTFQTLPWPAGTAS